MGDFKKLLVWRKAHELTLEIYKVTEAFPRTGMFGLSSQLRRASGSKGADIAEGSGRKGDGDFGRFLAIASGSLSEVEYHLLLSHDLGYLPEKNYSSLLRDLNEVGGILTALARRVQQPHCSNQG